MKIPGKIIKNDKKYRFIQRLGPNMFLYLNEQTGVKETFSKFDLELIDNTEIDKKLNIVDKHMKIKVRVYDKELNEEKEYESYQEAGKALGVASTYISNRMCKHLWIRSRYFVERIEEDEK